MIKAIELPKFYRLLNIGPTTLVSAKADDRENVMAVAWSGIIDYQPVPKASIVLAKESFTRSLIEQSGYFVIQVPVASQAKMVLELGAQSGRNNPRKPEDCGAELFYVEGCPVPLVKGCAGWILCKVIDEPHNQQVHDLFIGEVIGAWADDVVFDGHWKFEQASSEWRTLHYVAGGSFYTMGERLDTE